MERPARVRMRRRNPCVLWRRRLFGWKVRLLNVLTPLAGLTNQVVEIQVVDAGKGWGFGTRRHVREDVVGTLHQSTRFRPPNGTRCDGGGSISAAACGHPLHYAPTEQVSRRVARDTPGVCGFLRKPVDNVLIHRLDGC